MEKAATDIYSFRPMMMRLLIAVLGVVALLPAAAGQDESPAHGRRILSEGICEEWYRAQTPPSQAGRTKKSYSFGMEVCPDEGKIAHGGAYGTYLKANWKQGTCCVTFVQKSRTLPDLKAAAIRTEAVRLGVKVQ